MNQRILPPTYFIVLLILLIGTHFVFPIISIVPPPYAYLGAIPVIFGIVMNVWADCLFKKRKTTVKPYEIPTSLITSSPFNISRHPMYCGMAGILFGTAIILGSITAFIFPIAFMALMEINFIPQEEKNMSEKFGTKYADYKKKVRRWI